MTNNVSSQSVQTARRLPPSKNHTRDVIRLWHGNLDITALEMRIDPVSKTWRPVSIRECRAWAVSSSVVTRASSSVHWWLLSILDLIWSPTSQTPYLSRLWLKETLAFFRSPRSISSSQLVSCAFTHLFFLENELTPVTSQSSNNLLPERFKWQAGYSLNKTTTGSAQGKKVGMRWTHDDNPATQHNKGTTGANSGPIALVPLRRRTLLTQLVPLHRNRYWDNAAKKRHHLFQNRGSGEAQQKLAQPLAWNSVESNRTISLHSFKFQRMPWSPQQPPHAAGRGHVHGLLSVLWTAWLPQFHNLRPNPWRWYNNDLFNNALWDVFLRCVLGLENEHVHDLFFVTDSAGSCDLHDIHNLLSDL